MAKEATGRDKDNIWDRTSGTVPTDRTQKIQWMKKYISDKAHFEQARGNVQQNIEYCSKDDSRSY